MPSYSFRVPASDFVFGQQLMVDGGYTAIGHLPTPELAATSERDDPVKVETTLEKIRPASLDGC